MDDVADQAGALWHLLGGAPASLTALHVDGPPDCLPGRYDVTGFAAGCVAVAGLALAEVAAGAVGPVPEVTVSTVEAAAAFASEARFTPIGWELPPVWDPIAGLYRSEDGWIRLHTNYAAHRSAALTALSLPPGADRDAVTTAVARWPGTGLETAVVAAGGCAAVLRSPREWAEHPQGRATADEPAVSITGTGARTTFEPGPPDRPLRGLRVLDLTRVIAGPVCTRFLAAYGADVLRIDPPGFAEVPALLPDTLVGKRSAALDLRSAPDRSVFERLLGEAHVLVVGLRPDALTDLGYPPQRLREGNPGVVTARLDAYGWSGPWSGRRGFDSLVQCSTGIAHGADGRPDPLPVQALDHGTGYLLAAAVLRCLADGAGADIRASLVGTASLLGPPSGNRAPGPSAAALMPVQTGWGPAQRVANPGRVAGTVARWDIAARPLGADSPSFVGPHVS